jgi:hypothetical protein
MERRLLKGVAAVDRRDRTLIPRIMITESKMLSPYKQSLLTSIVP